MKKEFKQSTEPTSPPGGEVGAQRRVRGKVLNSTFKARTLRRNETEAERKFWNLVRNRNLAGYKFIRQYPIAPYIVDFVCRDKNLIVEIDGGQHCGSTNDKIRDASLNDKGYSILRFWNNEILQNKEGCCIVLLSVLQGAPSPGLRFAPATLSPKGRGEEGPEEGASTTVRTNARRSNK